MSCAKNAHGIENKHFNPSAPQTIEELYELTDAITETDWTSIKEELGDLMLHILFYSKIAEEQGHFNIRDVMQQISEKLIYRHPHIYGNVEVKNEEVFLVRLHFLQQATSTTFRPFIFLRV